VYSFAAALVGVSIYIRPVISSFLLVFSGICVSQMLETDTIPKLDIQYYQTALDRYCVTCHNNTLKTAGLMLDNVNISDVSQNPELWEKVVTKLSLRAMPPVGMPRPDNAFYESFKSYLTDSLDKSATANPNPGREAIVHRLNRSEYTNAVRDLLDVEIDGKLYLPPDDSGGFDNLGDLLSVSEVLIEKYLTISRMVSRLAVGDAALQVDSHLYTIDPKVIQHNHMSEDLPFGSRGGMAIRHRFPVDGEYGIKIRLQRQDEKILGLSQPNLLDARVDGKRINLFKFGGENVGLAIGSRVATPDFEQANYERLADQDLEVRFPVQAGTRTVQIAFLKEEYAWENSSIPPPSYNNFSEARIKSITERAWAEPIVSNITITGPYNINGVGQTKSREKIFICTPQSKIEEESCARQILSNQARLAFRRPVTDTDIKPLINLYREGYHEEGTFEGGIRKALEGILVSSAFLFRFETDPKDITAGSNYAVSDLALASRLSFFLWSSIPDNELLSLAEQGKLSSPKILESQVNRMLKDKRSSALVDNFAEQWLLLRNLPQTQKSEKEFPEFDVNLRQDLYKEIKLFVSSIFHEDHSILDLFQADYSYLNENLARHYEIDGIYGNRFRRVVLPKNQQGLLARAGILSITSYPNRNSTVLRGKWVLENILASPPPPPPEDIPSLDDAKGAAGEVLTLRERMEIHPANPVCAVCHNQMDPIGFGLENYDAIGKWRTEDNGKPINATGRLPSGVEFEGPAELQKALLKDPEVFVNAFAQKLLTYALGRPTDYYDMPTVREIVHSAENNDYRFSSIVMGIVNSVPFQMRRSGS
jgi:hypothetical protein